MPSHFTLRMQFGPHQDASEITEQLLRLVREAPVDEIMFFYFAEEQNDGHETLERVRDWIDNSRPYRDALKQTGVQVSLNPWHTLLHGDRERTLKREQPWRLMVDPNGREASAVVCPLDAAWRNYYYETLRLYAAEGFRVVWIDDDLRYHNHAPLEWGGCLCPLHVQEFNRRAGTAASRPEIVDACLAPGTPHPWRAIWLDMWQDTVLDFLHECRGILEGGGTRMGLMSSSMEAHAAEGRRWGDWWDASGGGDPPVHRPNFWPYSDSRGPVIVHGIATLDQNRAIQPPKLESGPEIENHPFGRWNKSFRQTFAQMTVAHVLGATNLNFSLHDLMGNRPDDEPERMRFLNAVRPSMDWLADGFPMSLRTIGVGVPWSPDMGRAIRTEQGCSWHELHCPSRAWAYWLGAAGIAFTMRPQDRVNALAGPMTWSFDDDTLKQWLASSLLLDGGAAAILADRGFGDLIGVSSWRMVTQRELLYSIEECMDPAFAYRVGGQISVNSGAYAHRMLQAVLARGAHPVSDLRDPLQRIVGHGAFTYENTLGGRVAVVPWDATTDTIPKIDIHRAAQLRRIVEWLAWAQETGWVEGGAWLVPQYLCDGDRWRGAVWNASPDSVDSFRLHRPKGMPTVHQAWHLTPTGERLPVPVEDDVVRLTRPMHQFEVAVFGNHLHAES